LRRQVADLLVADLVDLVEDIEQVALGVDADPLDARHDLGDDLLAARGLRLLAESLEVRDQLPVDEGQERLVARVVELFPLVR
jgi:hypothetical protein